MANVFTFSTAAREIRRIGKELEAFSIQTVANRKVFRLAISQFRSFSEHFLNIATDKQLNATQNEAYREIISIAREYQQLFSQNLLSCWAHTALDNSSTTVPCDLCSMASRMRKCAKIFDPQGSLFFDPEVPQWLQYHILDLRAVVSSFTQYISSAHEGDPVVNLMNERLNSINEFLREYEDETQLPGINVFSPIPVNYRSWRISSEDLEEIEQIGEGASSVVYRGTFKGDKEVAIKKLKYEKLKGGKLRVFQREVTILATAEHPCLLHLVGATDTPPYCIVTEWLDGGSLYTLLHTQRELTGSQKTMIAFDIARGMQFLHSRQILHRDLKSPNVLLDNDMHAKICDFGYSRIADNHDVMTKNVGTPHWMAPELLDSNSGYDLKVDVFSYGIVLWEILTRSVPYRNLEPAQIIARVLTSDLRPPMPEGTPPEIALMIRQCWDRDPKARPTFSEILRRFKSGMFQFPGTTKETLHYINETLAKDAAVNPQHPLSHALEKQDSLEEFVDVISSQNMEPELVDYCWNHLHEVGKEKREMEYSRGLAAFLKTPLNEKAAKELRKMKPGSAPIDCVAMAVAMIPTGNEEIDEDLIIAACKNGASGNAVLAAMKEQHLKMALEVAARSNIPVELVEGISKRCNACLTSSDPMLSTAALRCLVSIDAVLKVDIDALKSLLQSKDSTLRAAAFVTSAKFAQEGGVLPIDTLDMIAAQLGTEPLAGTVAACACTRCEAARHILGRIAHNTAPVEIMISIINQAVVHEELKNEIIDLLPRIQVPQSRTDITNAVKMIQTMVGY